VAVPLWLNLYLKKKKVQLQKQTAEKEQRNGMEVFIEDDA